jgi:hypothetical protein
MSHGLLLEEEIVFEGRGGESEVLEVESDNEADQVVVLVGDPVRYKDGEESVYSWLTILCTSFSFSVKVFSN